MADREKVIRHITAEISIAKTCKKDFASVDIDMLSDTLELLKEQEAKHVNISQTHCGMTYGLCPQCEKRIDTLVNPNYCGFCGQELKWK